MNYVEQFVASTWEDVARDTGWMPGAYFDRVYGPPPSLAEQLLKAAELFMGKKDERK
jgi:hypothetical protein